MGKKRTEELEFFGGEKQANTADQREALGRTAPPVMQAYLGAIQVVQALHQMEGGNMSLGVNVASQLFSRTTLGAFRVPLYHNSGSPQRFFNSYRNPQWSSAFCMFWENKSLKLISSPADRIRKKPEEFLETVSKRIVAVTRLLKPRLSQSEPPKFGETGNN